MTDPGSSTLPGETPTGETPGSGSLGRNTAIMAVGTLMSRISGFGRIVALAYALGFGRLADTYTLANNTPNMIYELIVGGVLSSTLVPVFVKHLNSDDEEEGWRAISAIVSCIAVAMVVLTVIFLLGAPLLVKAYSLSSKSPNSAQELHLATSLVRFFAPQVVCYGIIATATALLHAQRRFAAPMFAPILNNVVVIGVILYLPHLIGQVSVSRVGNDFGAVSFLGLGTTFGVVAMTLALIPALHNSHLRLRWRWEPRNPAVVTVVRLSGWTFGFVIANQLALFVVQFLAYGHKGDVSAYVAAYTLFIFPHGVFAVSVMSALQPGLATAWQRNARRDFADQTTLGLRLGGFVLLPAAAGYVVIAVPLVAAILKYGRLDAASALTTGHVFAYMAIGLPGFSAFLFLTRVFQSMHDTKTVFLLYLVENGANVVLALALYRTFGVVGLGFALGAAYWTGTLAALIVLSRRVPELHLRDVCSSLARIAAAAAASTTTAWLCVRATSGTTELVQVGVAVIAGGSLFFVAARLLRIPEMALLLDVRRRRPVSAS